MNGFFSVSSGFMKGMSRAADLIILNLMFLVCCIPVVTIGPAASALYQVIMAIGTAKENGVVLPFFRAFKENFVPALKVWLVMLAVAAALVLDLVLCSAAQGIPEFFSVVFWILLALEALTSAIAFPMISLFRDTLMGTLKNSLVLSVANLPRTVMMLLLWTLPVTCLLGLTEVFFRAAFLWIVIWFSTAAYLSSFLLKRIFAKYLPEEMFEEEAE